MLDLEQLLSDLRGLENELNGMGVEAVLDERDDGMPEFHFGEFGGGLSWWVNKGFYLTIWAGDLSDVYDTDIFCEFRHELMRRLADQYEGKAQDTRDTWGRLCGDDTPMPANLAEKADGYERVAERLRDAIKDDGVPVFIDNFAAEASPTRTADTRLRQTSREPSDWKWFHLNKTKIRRSSKTW